MSYLLLLTGSRSWSEPEIVTSTLDRFLAAHPDMTLMHGAHWAGVDAIGDAWAKRNNVPRRRFPADWRRLKAGAGPVRNKAMVEQDPDECLAFCRSSSPGTTDCVKRARAAGIPISPYSHGV